MARQRPPQIHRLHLIADRADPARRIARHEELVAFQESLDLA